MRSKVDLEQLELEEALRRCGARAVSLQRRTAAGRLTECSWCALPCRPRGAAQKGAHPIERTRTNPAARHCRVLCRRGAGGPPAYSKRARSRRSGDGVAALMVTNQNTWGCSRRAQARRRARARAGRADLQDGANMTAMGVAKDATWASSHAVNHKTFSTRTWGRPGGTCRVGTSYPSILPARAGSSGRRSLGDSASKSIGRRSFYGNSESSCGRGVHHRVGGPDSRGDAPAI